MRNVAPTFIGSIADQSDLDEGDAIDLTGSFSDPGADTWTITVDYGDDTVETLAFDDSKMFRLQHQFVDEGVYEVVVTIQDDDGGITTPMMFDVTIDGVAPNLGENGNVFADMSAIEGTAFPIQLLNQYDASPADFAAGFTYTYEYRFAPELPYQTLAERVRNSQVEFPAELIPDDDRTVYLRATVFDKDDLWTSHETDVSVSNQAPTGELYLGGLTGFVSTPVASPAAVLSEGTEPRLFFRDVIDPSPVDTREGLLFSFDLNGDGDYDDEGEFEDGPKPFADIPASLSTGFSEVNIRAKIRDKDGASTQYSTTLPINQTPTAITLDTNEIPENIQTVWKGVLSSVDDTPAGELVYSLVQTTNEGLDNESFQIVVDTGTSPAEYVLELRPGISVDFERQAEYRVRVAVDDGGNGFEQDLLINVVDVNEAPTAISLTLNPVTENTANEVFGTVSVDDPDTIASYVSHTFVFEPAFFEVDDGELRLTADAVIDFETTPELNVTITATDAGGSLSRTFTITVLNANEAPTALALSSTTVPEQTPGAVVGALTVNDPDTNDSHDFTVNDARFVVVGGELQLVTTESLDFETTTEPIIIEVTATDVSGLVIAQSFSIVVTDVNEAPVLSLPASPVVAAGENGALIGLVSATDPEEDGIAFTVSDPRFEVVAGELRLLPGESFDPNGPDSVTIDVSATDDATPPLGTTQTLTINVDKSLFFDFGDAPMPYPTSLSDDGAWHTPGPIRLGETLDIESDGQPRTVTTNADGTIVITDDDSLASDDEDGVVFVGDVLSGPVATAASVVVTVSGAVTGTGRIDAWIDFNQDGDWDDVGEKVFDGTPVRNGVNVLNFTVPAGTRTGETFARFRISEGGGLEPTGSAPDGEVEDHALTIAEAPIAWSVEALKTEVNESETLTYGLRVRGQMPANATTTVGVRLVHGTSDEDDLVGDDMTADTALVDAILAAIDSYAGSGAFAFVDGELTFTASTAADQDAVLTVELEINADQLAEPDEDFTVTLSAPIGTSGNAALSSFFRARTVIPANENAPQFSSADSAQVIENGFTVQTLVATDLDGPQSEIVFVIEGDGADNDLFEITQGNQLRFRSAPDFENPIDEGGEANNNVYVVTVTATDGTGHTTTQTVDVRVIEHLKSFKRFEPLSRLTASDELIFQVDFSGPASNVDATDFAVTGTTAVITNLQPVQGTGEHVYQLTVSGGDLAELHGTVELQLDPANDIAHSDGTVLGNDPPMISQSYVVDNAPRATVTIGTGNSSVIRTITIDFDSAVAIEQGAFAVRQLDGDFVDVAFESTLVAENTRATLTFSGDIAPGGSLSDGRYQLVIDSERIRDTAGNPLDGDNDGQAGGIRVDDFFRLFGDSDGDGDVDGQDYGRFGATFLKSLGEEGFDPRFDRDDDGDVDGQDYGQFGSRFLSTLDD
ncbi:MAG: GEVED domain-containing protein [Planctomycetota bacterium]